MADVFQSDHRQQVPPAADSQASSLLPCAQCTVCAVPRVLGAIGRVLLVSAAIGSGAASGSV